MTVAPQPGPYGIYVHVPWCRVRCPYCAFYVVPDRGDVPWEVFVDRLLAEYHDRRPAFGDAARTVFLGGGTPSRMPIPALTRLIAGLAREPGAEVSLEANPEDVDQPWLDGAIAAGVNRLSLGVQTLDPALARLLNRAHTVDQATALLGRVGRSGVRSWSLDLIFGVPGQTLADLRRDLEALLAYEPPHVSLYGLTIEPGTPFARGVERGTLIPAGDDLWREMYDHLVERLGQAGLDRYEVSNFARPGHESDHNRGYWHDRPYLGLGPSAHGYAPDGARWVNRKDLARYLAGDDPTETRDGPSAEGLASERLISGMRAREGVDLDQLAHRTGLRPDANVVEALIRHGLLRREGPRIALALAGYPVADAVVVRLVDALGAASSGPPEVRP